MKKTTAPTSRRKPRRRSAARRRFPLPGALPIGAQQALMGLAAFEARRA
jgi:hypothetical protein